jgi:hypothetical protein
VLHNRLDKIVSRHDCFKFDRGVDSSATFVSGLPVVNSSHSYVIARLALDLMHLAESFSIPFLINQTIALRVGIHTGKQMLMNKLVDVSPIILWRISSQNIIFVKKM